MGCRLLSGGSEGDLDRVEWSSNLWSHSTFTDPAPPPTEELCNAFNELRSDMVLLCELRGALGTCIFELESLKHQFEALSPGKVSERIGSS